MDGAFLRLGARRIMTCVADLLIEASVFRLLLLLCLSLAGCVVVTPDDVADQGMLVTVLQKRGLPPDYRLGPLEKDLIEQAGLGNLDRVRDLLEQGALADARNAEGVSPLEAAVRGDHEEVVHKLLEYNYEIWPDILVAAVEEMNIENLHLLLAKPQRVDEFARDGRTPLIAAVAWGDPDAVLILLDAGARANQKDYRDRLPMDVAKFRENRGNLPDTDFAYDRIEALLTRGDR